jgi:hypothetical protein
VTGGLFADDTNAIISAENITQLNEKVNEVLKLFNTWFDANKLQLNCSKTNALLFKTTANNKDVLQIVTKDVTIHQVDSVKFLGVCIDSSLTWKDELLAVVNSVSSACYALRSLRDEVKLNQLKTVYFALVESRMRYSIKFWGNSYKYNIYSAFIAQKRAIRIMARIPQYTSCKCYFLEFGILTVPSLYILVLLTDLFKNLSELETPEQRKQRLESRRKDLLPSLITKLNVVKQSAGYQEIVLFNKLSVEMKSLSSVTVFKNKLKAFLLKSCFYSVEDFCLNCNKLK